jgi:hypothetical protein
VWANPMTLTGGIRDSRGTRLKIHLIWIFYLNYFSCFATAYETKHKRKENINI